MPTIFIINGFRFYFYSHENDEPVHVHIVRGDANGKVWLEPEIVIAYMHGFKAKEIKQIMEIINEEVITLKKKWNEYFGE